MQPFEVKLSYNRKDWCTVPLEIGHDEIGDAEHPEWVSVHPDIVEIFTTLGFPHPNPVPLMPLEYQVAQKIHGASEAGSRRTHDLIDLQLIMANGEIDLAQARETSMRLFPYRKKQAWPPVVSKNEGWGERYASQSAGLDVLPTVDQATAWANVLIARIDAAGSESE